MVVWKSDWKKPVYGQKCPVFDGYCILFFSFSSTQYMPGSNGTLVHEDFACEMKVTVAVTFLVGIIQVIFQNLLDIHQG